MDAKVGGLGAQTAGARQTVFIAVFNQLISRNILNTGVLALLKERQCRVVLFVDPKKLEFYRSEYAHELVAVEPFDLQRHLTSKERAFHDFAWLLVNSNTKRFQEVKRLELHKSKLRYWYHRLVIEILSPSRIAHRIFRFADDRFNSQDAFGEYFEKYRPDVVFAPDVFSQADVLLMKSARRRGVRLVGMVRSWDNATSKHLLRVIPDTLLVQNEIIREEARTLHDVADATMQTVGIAHYEYYRQYAPLPRAEFCAALGIDPAKRIVMVAPAGEKFISTDGQTAELLKRAYAAGQLPDDVVTLIRVHFANPTALSGFTPDHHFVIERPGTKFEGMTERDKELGMSEFHHLLDTLYHCELVVNVLSSMVIDAAVLDKPVVTVGFDGWEQAVPFGNSVARYHADENMAKLLAIGGTPVAKNPEELVSWINTYLEHPETHRAERNRIVERQCWKLDGKAAERIASALSV